MSRVCIEAVRRGWRIGTHAAGDRAVRVLLDVYEAVVAEVGKLPPWTLVIEHALLSDAAQRARAVRGGFGITVQHALLWNMGSEMVKTWGPERTSRVNPLGEGIAIGADLAAGTDSARPFNPMTNVWGMATRGPKAAGVQGPIQLTLSQQIRTASWSSRRGSRSSVVGPPTTLTGASSIEVQPFRASVGMSSARPAKPAIRSSAAM